MFAMIKIFRDCFEFITCDPSIFKMDIFQREDSFRAYRFKIYIEQLFFFGNNLDCRIHISHVTVWVTYNRCNIGN